MIEINFQLLSFFLFIIFGCVFSALGIWSLSMGERIMGIIIMLCGVMFWFMTINLYYPMVIFK